MSRRMKFVFAFLFFVPSVLLAQESYMKRIHFGKTLGGGIEEETRKDVKECRGFYVDFFYTYPKDITGSSETYRAAIMESALGKSFDLRIVVRFSLSGVCPHLDNYDLHEGLPAFLLAYQEMYLADGKVFHSYCESYGPNPRDCRAIEVDGVTYKEGKVVGLKAAEWNLDGDSYEKVSIQKKGDKYNFYFEIYSADFFGRYFTYFLESFEGWEK